MLAGLIPTLLILARLAIQAATAFACPLCGKALAESGQDGLRQGLQWSLLLFLTVPALLITTFVVLVLRARRKARQNQPPAA